jgi:hypothetical protein
MKIIRTFITLLALVLIAAAAALFFQTEQKNKKMNDVKSSSEAAYSSWVEQNNCVKKPLPCESYSKQFEEWLSQFEIYKERKEQSPMFQGYVFLKNLDEQYFPDYDSGGWASLGIACALLLLFVLLISLDGKKKTKTPYTKPKISVKEVESSSVKKLEPKKLPKSKNIPEPKKQPEPKKSPELSLPKPSDISKPDALSLLKKATECAEDEPMQAINYLEQAIKGSLSSKLFAPAMLLCGSLRLKNKIEEKQGAEQLQKIISASPQSSEAKKAQEALNTFK